MGVTFVAWIAPKGGSPPPFSWPASASLDEPRRFARDAFCVSTKGSGPPGEPIGTPPRPLRGALPHTWHGRAATWEEFRGDPELVVIDGGKSRR